MKSTVKVNIEVDAKEFFSNILGSSPFHWEWWTGAEYDEGFDWETYPTDWGLPFLTVSILDPDDENEEKELTTKVCLNDLVRAYTRSEHRDWENHDASSSDRILQIVVFGEVVYA